MITKKITIKTSKEKFLFEVDEQNNRYFVYRISFGGWLGDRKDRTKIGETKTLEDAVALAKVSTNGSISDISID